jgi:HAD superfamily phosphatase (TIGR01668 family)
LPILMPSAYVARITDITPLLLHKLNVEAVLLDVDNTLAEDGSQEPFPGSIEWAKKIREDGFKLLIISNNCSSRVAPFAALYGLPFCSMAMKPLPGAYLHAARKLKVQRERTVVVGDQIFTDILGANLSGMKSVLVAPKSKEDSFSFRLRRRLEQPIRRKLELQSGIKTDHVEDDKNEYQKDSSFAGAEPQYGRNSRKGNLR